MTDDAHSAGVVVWGVPAAIECGRKFAVKAGVSCPAGCRLGGSIIEVHDADGSVVAAATVGDTPWPGTSALCYVDVELAAPEAEGLHAWEARFLGADADGTTHAQARAALNVRAVAEPACVLKVVAIDRAKQTPIKGARVVVHPYRAFTSDDGVAEIRLPKGSYRVFVSGRDYFPFRSDGEVNGNVTIRAELELDLPPSDADLWS